MFDAKIVALASENNVCVSFTITSRLKIAFLLTEFPPEKSERSTYLIVRKQT